VHLKRSRIPSAKEAFEHASGLAPGNEAIQKYLLEVAARASKDSPAP
jgi:hypothetical protein